MAFSTNVRRGHPILFILIIVLAIVEGSVLQRNPVCATAPHSFLAFASWWTVVLSSIYAILFWHSSNGSFLTSVLSHLIYLALTWIWWTAGAAAITASIGGGNNCSNIQYDLPYCNQLNAAMGFAWAVWLCVSFALVIVILRGISSRRRGEGMSGQLV
ncbi:hypothetical protein BKA62DRAFT_702257 [Auriculariales sp. MPI-PUGE-AT-0066]|nr:hypothetical protein BKA62DRAFT_702257 [Auriculariales sp. MPI-PUGE-AT-0066]